VGVEPTGIPKPAIVVKGSKNLKMETWKQGGDQEFFFEPSTLLDTTKMLY